MKKQFIYDRRQAAGRMEAIMVGVSGVAVLAAVFAFLSQGWLSSLTLLILGALAFALSQVFDLLGDLFASTGGNGAGAQLRAVETPKIET